VGRDTEFEFGWNVGEFFDVPTYACVGRITCTTCGKEHGHCDEAGKLQGEIEALKQLIADFDLRRRKNVNIAQYIQPGAGGERLPFIQPEDVPLKGASYKIIGCREVNSAPRAASKGKKASRGFHGLMLDIKNGTRKYCLPLAFDRFDIGKAAKQLKADDTDDWIGQSIKLVKAKGTKGGWFVNVA
jgi:hypothetical protein